MRESDKSRNSAWWRVRARLARDLLKDEAGGVLVYMTILIPVMMGVIGLAVDASRLFILNTEQKDMADAAALAGARELDGEYVDENDNAIVRATDAARNVVSNNPRWASDNPDVHIESIRFCEFLTGLPHERRCALDEDGTVGYLTPDLSDAADSRKAYFIEVITETRRVFPSFLVAVGAVAEPQSNAIAIAGSTLVACNVQSLMICNPFEDPNDPGAIPFTATEGEMFIFKAKQVQGETGGGGGTTSPQTFSPGDFGLVDHPDHPAPSGANATRDLLSLQSRNVCISSLVSPHQGHETQKVNQGINVRFDEATFNCNNPQCIADITSAPHVLRGTTDEACNANNPAYVGEHQYPLDVTDTTTIGSGGIRKGFAGMNPNATEATTAMNDYWKYHHGEAAVWPAELDSTGSRLEINTRYKAYLRELTMMPVTPPQPGDWTTDAEVKENPLPHCLPESDAGAERRIINAAVVDCLKWGVRGNSVNNIRVDTYVEFFISHPSKDGEIYTEFVRMMTPDSDDSKLKLIVQLYR